MMYTNAENIHVYIHMERSGKYYSSKSTATSKKKNSFKKMYMIILYDRPTVYN